MLASLAAGLSAGAGGTALLAGTGSDAVHLIIVAASDRGLCGGFNAAIARETRRRIRQLQDDGKEVKLLCVGRRGREALRREYGGLIVDTIEDVGRPRLGFGDAAGILQWDMATNMPMGGGVARAGQLSVLKVLGHEILCDPALADFLDAAEADRGLDPWQQANLAVMGRRRARAVAVDVDLVRRL